MKTSRKLISILLLCILSTLVIGTVVAEDLSLNDGATFTVPEGYSVQDNNGTLITLSDGTTAIVVSASDAKSPEEAKTTLESKGYVFEGQRDLTNFNNINVVEQSYTKDDIPVYGYICEVDGIQYIVTVAQTPDEWDITAEDNPANILISSLDVSSVQTG